MITNIQIEEIHNRIRSFEKLTDNWDSYNAPKPNSNVIILSHEFVNMLILNDIPISRINPSVKGGVAVTTSWVHNKKMSFEFTNDEDTCCILRIKTKEIDKTEILFINYKDIAELLVTHFSI